MSLDLVALLLVALLQASRQSRTKLFDHYRITHWLIEITPGMFNTDAYTMNRDVRLL